MDWTLKDAPSCGWVFKIRFRAIGNTSPILDVSKVSWFFTGEDTGKSEVLSKHEGLFRTFLNTPVCGWISILFNMITKLDANPTYIISIFAARAHIYTSITIIMSKSVDRAYLYTCLLNF